MFVVAADTQVLSILVVSILIEFAVIHTVFGRSSTFSEFKCFVTVVNMVVHSIGQMF